MRKITQEELNKIMEEHRQWLRNKGNGKRAVLDCVDFSELDISFINFQGAILTNSVFSNMVFTSTIFDSADLTGADFSKTKMTNISFSNSLYFNETNFNKINFKNAMIEDSRLNSSFMDCNFANSRIYHSIIAKSDFYSSNFSDANIINCKLVNNVFTDSNLNNTNFEYSNFLDCFDMVLDTAKLCYVTVNGASNYTVLSVTSPISIYSNSNNERQTESCTISYWKELDTWVYENYQGNKEGLIKNIENGYNLGMLSFMPKEGKKAKEKLFKQITIIERMAEDFNTH